MKTLATVLMVSATMLAGVAQADMNQGYPPEINTQSTTTRAQVVAELRAAQAADQVDFGDDAAYPSIVMTKSAESTKSRAEVRAELRAAEAAGQVDFGDDAAYPNLAAVKGTELKAG